MDKPSNQRVLSIKKYPNRRYYDATRSCHVTLHEVHDLIVSGKEVCITDSRSGEDITNIVLAQIILERDPPKLDIFPASIFHIMIRSNRQALRVSFERVFAPFMSLVASQQQQFDAYVRQTVQGKVVSPFDWASGLMDMFSTGGARRPDRAAGRSAGRSRSVRTRCSRSPRSRSRCSRVPRGARFAPSPSECRRG